MSTRRVGGSAGRRLARPAFVFLAALLFGGGPALGQTTLDSAALEAKVREISARLRCPVCLNLSIADSPSELARDMRDVVRDHLKRGETEAQIQAFFEARYGEWVDMKPKARGFNLLVWLLPVGVILGGGALIVLVVRRWIQNSAAAGQRAAAADTPVSSEYLKKVQEELAKDDFD